MKCFLRIICNIGCLLTAIPVYLQPLPSLSFQYLAEDTAIVAASNKYSNISGVRKLLMGSNYRQAWGTEVKLPVFYFSQSGLKVEKLGGSHQTKSLRMTDKNDDVWVLRTVDKDVGGGMLRLLRFTPAKTFKQDLISADHPYGAVVVSELSKACGIIAPNPVYYFVAYEEALGEYGPIFGNRVCMLEKYAPTYDGSDSESTDTVKSKLLEKNNYLVLQKQVLKARIIDMLVGDWDRHPDQFRWGVKDSLSNKYFYTIPRDRDHAFFYTAGIAPKLMGLTFMRYMSGFRKDFKRLKRFNRNAWSFDKRFLNELDKDEWIAVTKVVQKELSNTVIESATRKLPAAVATIDGHAIRQKLIHRRDILPENIINYYNFLSKKVTIPGTDQDEYFGITNKNGKLYVTAYRLADGKQGHKIYERGFDPSVTSSIKLEGGKGNDIFYIDKSVNSSIRLQISGGEGDDTCSKNGSIRAAIRSCETKNSR